ncbi:ABC transporter, iron(III) dicitrate-binding periplasmic protein (plasmid) [Nostoc sp. NIES-3756]|uniref:iron-siderophore ABC transporter substrate-binding protein n=1 Tax=Nostoc sp. NIES-3756 TaxID=1751286 RepID=UPI000721D25A|nr:iron-siderophore ABC transporter substrate-binding protein [Nostoc sp. NIES-3756]BAT56852.1 ABC transporter, iron(III) dicitrate-binding periplasmic protein [Nostoc sp. NIES-3756]BAY41886.1 ABC transporter, iron(III) dicitrate-binding periplasmic protein [Nostoc sp. NIES-2111]
MINKDWDKHIKLFLIVILNVIFLKGCYIFLPQKIYFENHNSIVSECRKVKHELGESCIPPNPQRIIVTDQESLESLVALGLKPIATTIANRVGSKADILKGKIDGITYLGKESQINIEKLVQLNPDLILGLWINPQEYKLFSQVAPTVSIGFTETGWKKTFKEMAKIVDRKQEAEKVLEQYQQRIEKLKLAFAQKPEKPEITVMRFYTDLKFTQFLNQKSFPVAILEELNLSIPLAQRQLNNSTVSYENVSLERVDLLEADAMFIALDPGAEENFQKYKTSRLWQTLNVVQKNRVYTVNSSYWIFGSVLSANAVLDDIVKYLLSNA